METNPPLRIATPRFGEKRYLAFRGEVIELTVDNRGLFVDEFGTVYAYAEIDKDTDPDDGCGVWHLKFPHGSPLDFGCRPHDFMYSSPAYQFFHTRAEADAWMRMLHEQGTKGSWYRVFVRPFYYLARWFGGRYWENDRTR